MTGTNYENNMENRTDKRNFISYISTEGKKDETNFNIWFPKQSKGCQKFLLDDNAINSSMGMVFDMGKRDVFKDTPILFRCKKPSGFYLDGDILVKRSAYQTDPTESIKTDTVRFAHQYIATFMSELGNISKVTAPMDSMKKTVTAYVWVRAAIETKGEGNLKYGFHIYFNDIAFSQGAKKAAWESTIKALKASNIKGCFENVSAHSWEETFDPAPVKSCTGVIPFSIAPGKTVGYQFRNRYTLELKFTESGAFFLADQYEGEKIKSTDGRMDYDLTRPLTKSEFIRSIPIYERERVNASSIHDVQEFEIIEDIMDLGDMSVDECILAANDGCKTQKALIWEWLKILGPEDCLTNGISFDDGRTMNGHEFRLSLINYLAHRMKGAEDDALDILNSVYKMANFSDVEIAHMNENFEEQRLTKSFYGDGWLKDLVIRSGKASEEEVERILGQYDDDTLATSILSGLNTGVPSYGVNESVIANAMTKTILKDYNLKIVADKYVLYKYDETSPIGPCYHKYKRVQSYQVEIMAYIRNVIDPKVRSMIAALGHIPKAKRGEPKSSTESRWFYLSTLKHKLGSDKMLRDIVSQFMVRVAEKSQLNGFAHRLDAAFDKNKKSRRFLTGCYDGILEFIPGTTTEDPKFVLHEGDNRDLFVSRSIGGCAKSLSIGVPPEGYQHYLKTFKDSMIDEGVLEYRDAFGGASMFAGEGGKLFWFDFGSGSDGKTTKSNCELFAGGHTEGSSLDVGGYACTVSPLFIQVAKKSASDHDAGTYDIFDNRLIVTLEPDEHKSSLEGSCVKHFTSNTSESIRQIRGEQERKSSRANYIMQSNISLGMSNADDGIRRRILCYYWSVKYVDAIMKGKYLNSANTKVGNPNLEDDIATRQDIIDGQIYSWGIECLNIMRKYKHFKCATPPEAIRQGRMKYFGQIDPTYDFFDSNIITDEDKEISLADMFRELQIWYQSNPSKDTELTIERFVKYFKGTVYARSACLRKKTLVGDQETFSDEPIHDMTINASRAENIYIKGYTTARRIQQEKEEKDGAAPVVV